MELARIGQNRYEIPMTGGMRVPGRVYVSPRMLETLRDDPCLEQIRNVAHLPGIVKASLGMPDLHWGYGFPIGGVAAMDVEEGVVSPGGVGYDINCGVRLMATAISMAEARPKMVDLVQELYREIPCGVGSRSLAPRLGPSEMARVLRDGAAWAVHHGLGREADLATCEEGGRLGWARPEAVGMVAQKRGSDEMGTLGSGNHFAEIQEVAEVFDAPVAQRFGLCVGQLTVMIHSGSRGLGYQVCDDNLVEMAEAMKKYRIVLPDRQLAAAPIRSPEGERYLGAMAAAANFAWANRQVMMHAAERALQRVLKCSEGDLSPRLVYDVCHNIAKREVHQVDGVQRHLLVHRKGATRAFGPSSGDLPGQYREIGQPVIIPGDMGRASFVLVGTRQAMEETFGSSCHGAGRVMSRGEATRRSHGRDIINEMEARGVTVRTRSRKTLAEEMPEAYKDVHEVVGVMHDAGVSRLVAKLRPVGVIKG